MTTRDTRHDVLVATSNPDTGSALNLGRVLVHAHRQYTADASKLTAAQKAGKPAVFLRHYQRNLDLSQTQLATASQQYERALRLLRAVDSELAHRIDEHVRYSDDSASGLWSTL